MKTTEKEARQLRTSAPDPLARPHPPTKTPTSLEPASLDGRLISFSQSAPLFLSVEKGKAPQRELDALRQHLEASFPELLKLHAALRRTKKHREELTESLFLHATASYQQLAAIAEDEVETSDLEGNTAADQSIKFLFDIQLAEERYQLAAEKTESLENAILEVTEAPYQRFVRWAIRESR